MVILASGNHSKNYKRFEKMFLNYLIAIRRPVFNNNYNYSKNRKVAEMDYDMVDTVETQKTLNKINNILTIIIETKHKDEVFRMPGNSSFPVRNIMFL